MRPSLVNLTPPGSPGGPMLMQALVRTPDQHEPVTNRNPLLKPSNRTCLQVAGLQERATAPGCDILCIYRSCSSVSLYPGDSRPGPLRRPDTPLAFFSLSHKHDTRTPFTAAGGWGRQLSTQMIKCKCVFSRNIGNL